MMGESLIIFSSLPLLAIRDKNPWGKLFSIGPDEVPPSSLAIVLQRQVQKKEVKKKKAGKQYTLQYNLVVSFGHTIDFIFS
jgi:hypothetical protein